MTDEPPRDAHGQLYPLGEVIGVQSGQVYARAPMWLLDQTSGSTPDGRPIGEETAVVIKMRRPWTREGWRSFLRWNEVAEAEGGRIAFYPFFA